jgi:hypothetical protein
MYELKNPDFTKTEQQRDYIRDHLGWELWWKVEHQYPYVLLAKQQKRIWCNPFYLTVFSIFWIVCVEKSKEKST